VVSCADREFLSSSACRRFSVCLWSDNTYLDFERSINFRVNQIRAALGDDSGKPRSMQSGRSAAKVFEELQNRMRGTFDHVAGCADRGSLDQGSYDLGRFPVPSWRYWKRKYYKLFCVLFFS
jgi:hypothetical protein